MNRARTAPNETKILKKIQDMKSVGLDSGQTFRKKWKVEIVSRSNYYIHIMPCENAVN